MTRLPLRLVVAAVLVALLPLSAHAQSYNAPHRTTLPAAGTTTIFVHAIDGSLRIEGQASSDSVRVTGTARAFSSDDADNASLGVEVADTTLHVRPSVPEPIVGTPRFDLTLVVPSGMHVRVEGGPGPLSVQNVATLAVEDWDGDAKLRDISGGVSVNQTSGSLLLQSIGGGVRVLSGGGRLTARELQGGITVERHGSGRITIGRSSGPVVITNDGAGDVEVYDLDGSVHVTSDGAGDIQVRDLTGGFRVDTDTAGRIRHTNVQGPVRLPE